MGIQRNNFEAAFRALRLWAAGLNVAPESAPKFYSGSGAPTAADPNGSAYLRTDGGANTTLYVMVSSSWVALTSDAAADAIADTNTYYTTDTIDGAFDALGVQIGGDTDATFNFTEANVLADDDAIYAALEKLDLKWGDLASTANGEGAALVSIEDASTYYTGTTVEVALDEIEAQIGGDTSTTYNFTEANVCTDNTAVYANLEALDLKFGDLASTANGEGASLVAIEDAGAYTSAANVEAALAEIYGNTVTCTLTPAAEASNVIAVTIDLVSITGAPVSRTQRLVCSLYEATMIEAVAAQFTMAETGTGTEISTTANARLIIETDASGDAVVSVTDVATASGKTMYLKVEPIPPSGTNEYGLPVMVAITFDGS